MGELDPLHELDVRALRAWLAEAVPAFSGEATELRPLAGGTSNAVYRIRCGDSTAIIRRPLQTGDRIIEREARVLRALAGSRVPHPKLLGFCDDLAVWGARFMVMEDVTGRSGPAIMEIADSLPPELAQGYAEATVNAAAALAKFDHAAAGLEDFGKPQGFLERQVDRWLAMLDSYGQQPGYQPRQIPELSYVSEWLRDHTPLMSRPALLHGDIGFSNSIFGDSDPPQVVALLDWETSTIGDPLLDLARAVMPMNGEGRPQHPTSLHNYSNFPTREALARRYSELTGRSIENLDYYVVLAQFKLAIILERHHTAAVARSTAGAESMRLARYAQELFTRAKAVARGVA